MLDAPLRLSLPAVLIFIFVVVSACWWYASLLSRNPHIDPFRSRTSRWFYLLDAAFCVLPGFALSPTTPLSTRLVIDGMFASPVSTRFTALFLRIP